MESIDRMHGSIDDGDAQLANTQRCKSVGRRARGRRADIVYQSDDLSFFTDERRGVVVLW